MLLASASRLALGKPSECESASAWAQPWDWATLREWESPWEFVSVWPSPKAKGLAMAWALELQLVMGPAWRWACRLARASRSHQAPWAWE